MICDNCKKNKEDLMILNLKFTNMKNKNQTIIIKKNICSNLCLVELIQKLNEKVTRIIKEKIKNG